MWCKILLVTYFWVYVTKFICYGTSWNRKDRWITVHNAPTWRRLVVYNGTFCLKLNAYTSQFHCLLLLTACNFKLFQYEYIIVSHVLHSTDCVYTDPLYYHSINRYSWINCAGYGIIDVSADNCSNSSTFFTV